MGLAALGVTNPWITIPALVVTGLGSAMLGGQGQSFLERQTMGEEAYNQLEAQRNSLREMSP